MRDNLIIHQGVVVEKGKDKLLVNLLNVSSCSACQAKSLCNVSEMSSKSIEVNCNNPNINKGETVNVLFEKSLAPKALFLAYIVPFVLVFATLVTTWLFTQDEIVSGLLSLGILVPYYIILSFYNKSLQKEFEIKIEPIGGKI